MGETHNQDSHIATWLHNLPKVELHLHLEGAIPLPALLHLVQKYGGERPATPSTAPEPTEGGAPGVSGPSTAITLEDLQRRFTYTDFPHFLEMWQWKNGFLREYEDFTFIAETVARDLVSQNIRYAEVFASPTDFARHGLRTGHIIEAIRTGLNRVPEISVALVPDLVRNSPPEAANRTLSGIAEVMDLGVIGIGIGGAEHDYPPEPFAALYERARAMDLRTSAHAGEATGPESVWGAVRELRVDRIGHGTRAVEDPALMDYLAEHQVPVEMCPISNVRTGVVASLREHPVRTFFDRGIPVSINTDDPRMFGTSLAQEYAELMHVHGFTPDAIRTLILTAIRTSWMSDEDKTRMEAEFSADPEWTPTEG